MKRIAGIFLVFSMSVPIALQGQDIELASYTPEQRWERAASQFAVSGVAALAFAKSMGQTVEEYAGTVADLFAPGWGEPGSGSLSIVRGMHRNFSLFPNAEFEIVEQSGESVTARVNRPWAGYFGEDETWYGVTLEEYEESNQIFLSRLCEYLGLGYEEWTEDGWVYLKFSL
jgi:hypothetical protein